MSISPIVDENYRIQAADLQGLARQVVIANVTYQGVEAMAPVLHFEGLSKRLVLAPEQVNQIVEITGTTLFRQWIGRAIILQPRITKTESAIFIKAVTAKQQGQPMPVYLSEDRRGWYLALSTVAILLTVSIVFAVLNATMLLNTLQLLRDNWPLR
jgi:hypothetical protein